jgi:hypothetical protein
MIGIKSLNSFQGKSLLDSLSPQHTIQLVQPYDGLYIASVLYPYKYIYREHTGEELLFNVQIDPLEENNLIDKQSDIEQAIVDQLRMETKKAYFNQKLIEENRIWPN